VKSALATFTTVRTEGSLLPADILLKIAQEDKDLGGIEPGSYHLDPNERLREAASRAWNQIQAAWVRFKAQRDNLGETDLGTSLTRERWLLPLFRALDYGQLQPSKAEQIEGKSYAISHRWEHVPIHLVGCRVDLDKRTGGVAGASRSSPHSLVQEYLNRKAGSLWGIVSNGSQLRLLRDNISLTRQAYVEFDLEAMMEGEAYPDFVLLWLLLHQSRFESERPDLCWVEKWSQAARTEGVRVLDGLRDGVQKAIERLGQGFLADPANAALREKLRSGELDRQDYYRQLLRLVYRLLFLFVAEDRDLLLLPNGDPAAKKRYREFYTTTRLRRLATIRAGSRHHDLYCGLKLVMDKLSGDGCPELALPTLGSFLFSHRSLPDIDDCKISNLHLLDAIRSLAVTQAGQTRRVVDYKNLGAEELGSVYESLLELHPDLNAEAATFELKVAAGSERKKTGSYYTPTSLISCLLDSALDPVLGEASKKLDPEAAILKLKIVDPACGSGHFLIAAAHRIAKRLAAVRTDEDEPPPDAQRTALRDVIGHCIYGVDVNPMAVELCKVSLWMEAVEPGKPLSFLEHRIQCGNSLLGTTPALLENGIPDGAFTVLTGDSPEAVRKWKKVNRDERVARHDELLDRKETQRGFAFDEPWMKLGKLAQAMAEIDTIDDNSIDSIHKKEERWREAVESSDYLDGKLLADAWCSAFVWKKDSLTEFPITEDIFREIERNPNAFAGQRPPMYKEVRRLADRYRFLQWHLAFPDVFRVPANNEEPGNVAAGWSGGFDVVLGNPPWEQNELKEQEWFATRCPEIASAEGKRRKSMISELANSDPALWSAYLSGLRDVECDNALLRQSGRYPLCGAGRMNTYALFAEHDTNLLTPNGRIGIVVPSGIATDNTTKEFFASLIEQNRLVRLYDFENAVGMFEGVGHGRFKFCLLTLTGAALPVSHSADFFFFAHTTDDLRDESRHFTLTAEEIGLINPNTRTCPIFRSKRDAEITKAIYRRVPVLVNETSGQNPWSVSFKQGLFNMTSDSHVFRTRERLESDGWVLRGNIFSRNGWRYLPLYEAKMMHQYTHRFGDYAMKPEGSEDTELPRIPAVRLEDPDYVVMPRYWVPEWEVIKAISRVPKDLIRAVEAESEQQAKDTLQEWISRNIRDHRVSIPPLDDDEMALVENSGTHLDAALRLIKTRAPEWVLGFRDIARSTDERTAIFGVLPPVGANHKTPLIFPDRPVAAFIGAVNCIAFDYLTRQNIGGTSLGFFILKQLCVPAVARSEHRDFIASRIIELTYTAWDLVTFAHALGFYGPPFRWDEERRFVMRCELDAIYFRIYGIGRYDADYILDTFPIVRRKDETAYGEYRTRRVILEMYDAITEAERLGVPYETRLDPPPADPRCRHPRKKVGILAFGSLIGDPGCELGPRIVMRIKTETPFPVEYGRLSTTRGGAPTLVPHPMGAPVSAEVLVLDDNSSVADARDMLWRRERRKECSGESYVEGRSANSVLVRQTGNSPWVCTTLYTDFNETGKIAQPVPAELASCAIRSVGRAEVGKDGISYLLKAIASGIKTPLTDAYRGEILKQTKTASLTEALEKARTQ